MKKIKKVKFNKMAALALIVSVSGSGSPAYAITLSGNKSLSSNTANTQHYKNSINIKRKLDKLVKSGSINKFQETTVLKYLVTYRQTLRNPNLDKLSTNGPIPKNQEIIISNLFTTYKNSISKAVKDDFTSKLDSLINSGMLTQLQKNAIINLYSVSVTNREELTGIETLLTNGTITKDQEISILNNFNNSKKTTYKTINDLLLSKLDKLLSDGTINDEQRTAVLNLTRVPAVDSQKLELHRRLDTLVTIGTITKQDENNIINAILVGTK